MKRMACLLMVLLSLPIFSRAEDAPFLALPNYQPVKLRSDVVLVVDETEPLLSPEGIASQRLMNAVHEELTGGYRVVDVHGNRIVLLLATSETSLLRIAQWNEATRTYTITDWPDLPDVYLDTYHDGNSVLFAYCDESSAECEAQIMLALEELDGKWQIIGFTDAMTYYAERTETGFLFCDYWECEDSAYHYSFTSQTEAGKITWCVLTEMIDEYNALFPLRPALNDAYWDEMGE